MSGLDEISVAVVGYAVVVVLVAAFCAVRWRARPPWLDSMAWFLELLCLLRAVAGFGAIAAGHQPAELSTNVGYLLASVCILPLALRSIEDDRELWSVAVVGVAALGIAVIGVRTMMTV